MKREKRNKMKNGCVKRGETWYAVLWGAGKAKWYKLPPLVTTRRQAETARAEMLDARERSRLRISSKTSSGLGWGKTASVVLAKVASTASPSWCENCFLYVKRFRDHIGNPPAEQVSEEDCREFLRRRREQGVSESTLRKEMSFLRRVFRRAGNTCWDAIPVPREPMRPPKFLSPDQFQALGEVAHRRPAGFVTRFSPTLAHAVAKLAG